MMEQTKRKRLSSTPSILVYQVPPDILLSVFNKLTFIDLVQAKAVCSSWRNSIGEEFISRMPWLMLPSKEDVEQGDYLDVTNNGYNRFFNLGEKRVYNLKTTPKEFRECCCIGSSHGWLVFLGEKSTPFLCNPFSQTKIKLPDTAPLLGLKKMERNMDGQYELDYINGRQSRCGASLYFCSKQQVRDLFIQKAILTGKPDSNNETYGMFLLCNMGKDIAYHESGKDCWTFLNVSHPSYQDIISHKNNLYALSDKASIEIWELEDGASRSLTKKSDIEIPFPDKSVEKECSLEAPFTIRLYLVESCGDILLVVRFIGDFVDWDGTLLKECDIPSFGNHPIVCPYRTFLFHIYRLNFDEKKWVEMESLGDRALFLGGNHSISVSSKSFPNCESNSIYFTDDNWGQMEEDYLYGGHDMGIYNLKDESVEPIYEFFSSDNIQVQPPPCWIIPPACN